jgi:hypothetical protein
VRIGRDLFEGGLNRLKVPFAWGDTDDEGVASVVALFGVVCLVASESSAGGVGAEGIGERIAKPPAPEDRDGMSCAHRCASIRVSTAVRIILNTSSNPSLPLK